MLWECSIFWGEEIGESGGVEIIEVRVVRKAEPMEFGELVVLVV